MDLLKRIGMVFLNVASVVAGLGPILAKSLPAAAQPLGSQVITDFTAASQIIITAQGMFTAVNGDQSGGGKQRLQMAAPFIAKLILQAEPFAGKEIADKALFEQGVNSVTSGMADVLKSLKA